GRGTLRTAVARPRRSMVSGFVTRCGRPRTLAWNRTVSRPPLVEAGSVAVTVSRPLVSLAVGTAIRTACLVGVGVAVGAGSGDAVGSGAGVGTGVAVGSGSGAGV